MKDKTKKSSKKQVEEEEPESAHQIKPSKDKARVDTSDWPLLLKVHFKNNLQ